jgi:ribonuclease HI
LVYVNPRTGEVVERRGSGGFPETTNNRQELTALLEGLRALKAPCEVKVYTDSEYVMNPFTKGWLARWKANGWRRATAEDAPEGEVMWCPDCTGYMPYIGEAYYECNRHVPPTQMVKGMDRKAVKNRDLWAQIEDAMEGHDVSFEWVKGHSEVALNEDCDLRAGQERQKLIAKEMSEESERVNA